MKAMVRFIGAACLLWLAAAGSAGAAVLYQIIDLGTVNGASRSEARGITQSGQVWGENFNTFYPYFTWKTNTITGVPKPADVATMAINGMNEAGQFAGTFSYSTSKPASSFVVSPAWPQVLATNFGPRGINLWGTVVGITTVKVESPPGSGILFTVNRPAVVKGRALTRLSTLAGDSAPVNSEAMAINDNGVVVGWSVTSSNRTHAFLWDGTMHDLHTLGTRSNSVAVAINRNGTVVGYMYDFSSFREPFIWTASNGMTALTLPGGYSTGQPLGLNNRDDVVGVAGTSAVLWTNGVMTDLQTVIPTSPLWDLDGAYGINDAGEICGYGKNFSTGSTTGFLLRPTNAVPAALTVEWFDPADAAVTNVFTGTGVTTNTAILNLLTARRAGAAADGATRLILRATTTNQGTLSLSLRSADGATGVTGNPAEDGHLGAVGGMPASDHIDVVTAGTSPGIHAYALYRAPDIFHRAGGDDDSLLPQRVIYLKAEFTPLSGPVVTQMVALIIVRPPVIVMHGLWSDRAQSFAGFEQALSLDEAGVQIFGPSYPNAISFRSNSAVVGNEIANASAAFREQGFACTRADIFAHSMGGVLSRIHAGRTNYKRSENYQLGDINRLITIDSPHRGSFIADNIDGMLTWLSQNDFTNARAVIEAGMGVLKMPPNQGAGHDLMTTSAEIIKLNQRSTDVAAHVIVGDYTLSGNLTDLPQPLGGFYRLLNKFPALNLGTLFFSPIANSDLVVSVDSQGAGLLASNSSSTFNHQHVGAANTSNVIAKCLSLYEKPPSSDRFAKGFPVGWTPLGPSSPPPPPSTSATTTQDDSRLYFASGTDVLSGQTISVSVSEPGGTNFSSVLLLASASADEDTNAPFNFTITIPAGFVGNYPVSYLAVDGASNTWWGTQTLSVTAYGTPSYLEAEPRRFLFAGAGASRQITATGYYFGVPRNLTDAVTGTTYTSADTNVVTVDTNGLMTARGAGSAQITIANGGKNAFVDVVVNFTPSSDLALVKSASVSNSNDGTPLVFNLSVTNVGGQTANGVYLTDPLPGGAQFQSATTSQGTWSFTNGVFAAELGTLAPGAGATAAVTVTFSTGGSHTNTASISATGLDANEANNEASAAVSITVLPVLGIVFDGTNVVLSWSTNAAGFQLEKAANLGPSPTWDPAATNPPTVGDHFQFSIPPSNAPGYFRLRQL